jgi:hydroxymethylbilane synthase
MVIVTVYDVGGKIVKKDILGSKYENIDLGRRLAQKILEG